MLIKQKESQGPIISPILSLTSVTLSPVKQVLSCDQRGLRVLLYCLGDTPTCDTPKESQQKEQRFKKITPLYLWMSGHHGLSRTILLLALCPGEPAGLAMQLVSSLEGKTLLSHSLCGLHRYCLRCPCPQHSCEGHLALLSSLYACFISFRSLNLLCH
jgi:hypothetical protein